jgi:hypothetical protein
LECGFDNVRAIVDRLHSWYVAGNNGVALSMGLNWYLRYYCKIEISWGYNRTGDQMHIPSPWPQVEAAGVRKESSVQYRYRLACVVIGT